MIRYVLPSAIIVAFLAAYSAATNNNTKLPTPPEFDPQAIAAVDTAKAPEAEAGTQSQAVAPAKASGPSADCQCENCDCENCTCGQVTYQNVTVNETYYAQVCEGNTCRLVPRVRQVVRRVAVGTAARAANVVRAAVQVPQQVRMNVSGGSAGNYVSSPVYVSESVSYGSTGTSYGSAGVSYGSAGTSYTTSQAYPVQSRRQPVRNLLRCLMGR